MSKNGICCVVPSIYMIIKRVLRGKIIAFENPFSHNSVAFEFKEYFLQISQRESSDYKLLKKKIYFKLIITMCNLDQISIPDDAFSSRMIVYLKSMVLAHSHLSFLIHVYHLMYKVKFTWIILAEIQVAKQYFF